MKPILLGAMGLIFAAPLVAGELETSHDNLKQAVQQKDVQAVKKCAAEASALARKTIATPAPAGVEAKAAWQKQVAYAKEVSLDSEHALYATAIQAEPAVLIDLIATLEKQNPKSKYLDEAYGPYFEALEGTGAGDKVAAIAEKAIIHQPENEDLLLALSDAAMAKRQTARAAVFAERLIAVMKKHPKPEKVSDADWEYKRNLALGHAYYAAGMAHSEREQFAQADQDLRAASTLVKDEQVLGAILFHLGVANYHVGMASGSRARVLEAVKFSEQSAALKTPFTQPATANVQRMREEAARLR
ncbi:hypothetical protein [uncultured Paludibaculum sp.]|uniref:hypothetical protein n=1 Tax=uncultured Paludibaculum sp. TaxID=1765020 RepID=UPI002AAB6541|nr:hypothetical protein [uncultured Paludibaculum sp.]